MTFKKLFMILSLVLICLYVNPKESKKDTKKTNTQTSTIKKDLSSSKKSIKSDLKSGTSKSQTKKSKTLISKEIDTKSKFQNVKDSYPYSVVLSFFLSPEIFIFTPISNYLWYFAFTGDIGVSFEYRFLKWIGVEGGLYINTGANIIQTKYEDKSAECYYEFFKEYNLDMYIIDLFIQHTISMKFYSNEIGLVYKNKRKNDLDKMKFFWRIGNTFEISPLSYYFFYRNNEYLSEGSFFDDKDDGPNAFGKNINYKNISNLANIGAHLGFGVKLYNDDKFYLMPEFKYTFFIFPVTDGKMNSSNVKGVDAILIRNDGKDDKNLLDYKMQIEAGVSISFNFKQVEKIIKMVLHDLNFYPDSPKLLPESEKMLLETAFKLKKFKIKKLEVIGHAAGIGNKKKEKDLSILRARTVRDFFVNVGVVNKLNSSYDGKGSDEPIGDNKTDTGRKKNRRVELFIHQ